MKIAISLQESKANYMEIKGGNETFYFTKLHIDFSFINKYHMLKEL